MEFRLLGAVEAAVHGVGIRLGPPRHRFVLAVLALEAGRVVPLDRLIDLSWPDSPPPSATHAIQVAVSRIRSVLADAGALRSGVSLLTSAPGYLLEVDRMRVDAHRFRALFRRAREAGDDETRIGLLREGLDLWRGPALAGTGPGTASDQLARGLAEARLLAIEDCMEASLRLGRHREVLDELTSLMRVHPARERLAGQLMLALYRSGLPVAALDEFSQIRRHLASEFGIAPGAELERLQVAILRNDPALAPGRPVRAAGAAPAPPGAGLPDPPAGFVGRCAQLRWLTRQLHSQSGRNAGTVITISGPAGVGKSALALRWAHIFRDWFPGGQFYVNLRAAGATIPDIDLSGPPGKRILIIVDNADNQCPAGQPLPLRPDVFVLVTSRSSGAENMYAKCGGQLDLGPLSLREAISLLAGLAGGERISAHPAAAALLAQICGRLPVSLRMSGAHLAAHPEADLGAYVADLSTWCWPGQSAEPVVCPPFLLPGPVRPEPERSWDRPAGRAAARR